MAQSSMARVLAAVTVAVFLGGAQLATAQTTGEAETEAAFFAGITGAGARAMGMGGAFIAIADDATASSWNPAGLCVLEKPEAAFVGQPAARYNVRYPQRNIGYTYVRTTDSTTESTYTWGRTRMTTHQVQTQQSPAREEGWAFKAQSRTLDFAALTWPLRFGRLKLVPQLSYQRVVDLGLDYDYLGGIRSSTTSTSVFSGTREYTTTYNDGRTYSSTTPLASTSDSANTSIRGDHVDNSGGIDVVAGSLGVSFTSKLYLGVAVNRWSHGSSALRTTVTDTQSTSTISTQTTTYTYDYDEEEKYSGTSVNVGVLFKPVPRWSVGAVYKQGFTMDYSKGQTMAYRSNSDYVYAPGSGLSYTRRTTLTTQNIRRDYVGTLNWPGGWGVGTAVMPTDFLTFALDYSRTSWAGTRWNNASTGHFDGHDETTVYNTNGTTTPTVTDRPRTEYIPAQGEAQWPVGTDLSNDESGASPRLRDTEQVRLGMEYVLRRPGFLGLVVLPLRAGLIRDGQMLKNRNDLSGVTYYGVTAGFGLVWKRYSLDMAWVHTRGSRNESFGSVQLKPTTSPTTGGQTVTVTSRDQTASGNTLFRSNRLVVSGVVRLF